MKNPEQEFKNEMDESVQRYYSTPGITFEMDIVDEYGRKLELHEGLKPVFDEWKSIQSKWDRTSVLFKYWDRSHFNGLKNGRSLSGLTMTGILKKVPSFIKSI